MEITPATTEVNCEFNSFFRNVTGIFTLSD